VLQRFSSYCCELLRRSLRGPANRQGISECERLDLRGRGSSGPRVARAARAWPERPARGSSGPVSEANKSGKQRFATRRLAYLRALGPGIGQRAIIAVIQLW